MQTNHELVVEPIGLDVDKIARPMNFAELFGNNNPIELEIGMGKGTFITEQAAARKDTNFFGIEYAKFYWRYCSDRLRRNGCDNARTARAEAGFFLHEFVPDGAIRVLHIYFPDPWPKARHNKRRLIQEKFMPTALRILEPAGRIQVVTDHSNYFEQIDRVIRSTKGLTVIDYNRPGSAGEGEFVGTNFERKYRREGRPFNAIAAVKNGEYS